MIAGFFFYVDILCVFYTPARTQRLGSEKGESPIVQLVYHYNEIWKRQTFFFYIVFFCSIVVEKNLVPDIMFNLGEFLETCKKKKG